MMIPELLKHLGYRDIDDAVDLLVCGLCTLPALLMLTGFVLAGTATMLVLLVLVGAVGIHAPLPKPRSEDERERTTKKTGRRLR